MAIIIVIRRLLSMKNTITFDMNFLNNLFLNLMKRHLLKSELNICNQE